MGRFFTSTQIYNPKQLDREGFKADFSKKMKKEGYEICEADCAELSYVIAFADNCKWVTISSEAYEQGNRTAQADTARIAKMLKTTCINTTVIDSDCAMLDLYDDKGKKADTAVMGRADDYLGDDIPEPAKAVWEKLLSADSTWEQFMSVVQGNYVFAEDGLSELAPVIEMDSGNILFEYDDANENNENICFLSFRKDGSKKEKKITLNAAFKQVFGEALEPLGFQLVKGRYPYFVRVVNGEIIHIITIAKETSGLRGKKAFNIYGDIATVYRDKIDLSENPEYRIISMTSSYNLLRKAHPVAEIRTDEEKELIKKNRDYYYEIDNEESLFEELKVSLKFTKQILLPYIESVSDIDAAFTYLPYGFWDKCDGLLGLKTKRYREILEKKVIEREQQYKRGLDKANYYKISNGYTQEKYEEMLQKHDEFIKEMAEPIEKILNSPELSEKYNKELERRKAANIQTLKAYGIEVK